MRLLTALVVLTLTRTPAWGAFSGLTLIPTADTLGPGQVCLDYEVDGPYPVGSGPEVVLLNSQLGVGNRAELGLDFDPSAEAASGAMLNGKLLLRPADRGFGLAVGFFNVGEELAPTGYGVGTLNGGRLRLHAGVQGRPEGTEVFGGLDCAITDRLQFWAEHVRGDDGASALSLAYQSHPHWGISFGWQDPNDGEADRSYSVHAGCVWPAG